MNVLKITSSFPRYEGDFFGPWILEYARELKRQGHSTFIVAPNTFDQDNPTVLSENQLSITRFNYSIPNSTQKLVYPPGIIPQLKENKFRFFQIPFLLWQYYQTGKKIIQKNKIDIIHSQWAIPGGFIGALLARKFGLPHVITSQGAEFFLPTNHPFSRFTKFTLKNCDYLFPVSRQMGERAKQFGVDPSKIEVIPNAVNPSIFSPDITSTFRKDHHIPEDATVIITIRRLVFEKRVEDVIEAFAKLKASNTYLIIGGDGPDRSKLEQLCKDLDITDRVIFLGFVSNNELPPIYAASDIYVLSSQQEGLSLSLLESMSSGLITISTAATGGNEVIEHGKNGYLYKVADVEQLTSLLQTSISLSTDRQKLMSQQARQTVIQKFSVEVMVKQWIAVYDRLLLKSTS